DIQSMAVVDLLDPVQVPHRQVRVGRADLVDLVEDLASFVVVQVGRHRVNALLFPTFTGLRAVGPSAQSHTRSGQAVELPATTLSARDPTSADIEPVGRTQTLSELLPVTTRMREGEGRFGSAAPDSLGRTISLRSSLLSGRWSGVQRGVCDRHPVNHSRRAVRCLETDSEYVMLDPRHPASAVAIVNDVTTGEPPDRRLVLGRRLVRRRAAGRRRVEQVLLNDLYKR